MGNLITHTGPLCPSAPLLPCPPLPPRRATRQPWRALARSAIMPKPCTTYYNVIFKNMIFGLPDRLPDGRVAQYAAQYSMAVTDRSPLAWYGGAPTPGATAALAALTTLGFAAPAAGSTVSWQEAHAVIVACPAANQEEGLDPSFAALPSLQELSFRQPASRLLIWDPFGDREATVATDLGMTGVARPAGPPCALDPWQLNDYGLARWVHVTEFLVGFEHDRLATCCRTVTSVEQLLGQLAEALPESAAREALREHCRQQQKTTSRL